MRPTFTEIDWTGSKIMEQDVECQNIEFEFRVRNTYLKYEFTDYEDQCLPYNIEGEWRLHYSDEEALESSIEDALREELNPENYLQEIIDETNKEEFAEEIKSKGDEWGLTPEQKIMLENMSEDSLHAAERIKQQAKDRFMVDHVQHNFEKARHEQKDWYMRGRDPAKKFMNDA